MVKPRFKAGDEVYIKSRYNGIVKRKIVSFRRIKEDGETRIYYELDRLVQTHKDGHCVGSKKSKKLCGCCVPELTGYTRKEKANFIDEMQAMPYPYNIWAHPCPEWYLMQIGDKIYNTHPIIGGETDEILTEEKINGKNPNT